MVKNLIEFPEIVQFVTLQRLFWFGRKGFLHNPISADINTDNDSWLGSMLWQLLLNSGGLQMCGSKYHLDFNYTCDIFLKLTTEIDNLILSEQEFISQNQNIQLWMEKMVQYKTNMFILPQTFRAVLEDLQDIEEIPHFQAPYSYSLIEELIGAIKNEKYV